jgi:biopolymer transport protein ExbD
MKLPTRPRGYGLQFDITPLINVVFNLIILFLVVANVSGRENQEAIDLPRIDAPQEHPESPHRLVITIAANGQMHMANQPVSVLEIESVLLQEASQDPLNYEVQIRGDAATPYSIIESILLLCRKYGVRNVGFKVHEAAQ